MRNLVRLSSLLFLASHVNGNYAQQFHNADFGRRSGYRDAAVVRTHAPFYHGVASGDPLNDRVILWTRLTPSGSLDSSYSVTWQVSTDMLFSVINQQGTFVTDSTRDFTVKVDADGLLPGVYYYYRFEHNGIFSIIGRTRTAPSNTQSNLKFAAVSCSDYRQGYFTAYRKIAERNDIDAVLHMGDYIYETGGGPPDRLHDPNAEIYRLIDYRARLSQYHLDPDLMRCHQLYPFITIWDDHDIVVDAHRDTSERHNGAFGNYQDRKYVAIKAAREWLPMRDDSLFFKNWRKFSYGDLAEIFMIDARLYDRDRFAVDSNDTIYGSPYAKMIGPEQMTWLKAGLSSSNARWKIIGNQLMMGQFRAITNDPLVYENWDGYPAERNEFIDHLINNSINNVVVLTGDFHCSFALDVCKEPRDIFQYNPFNGNGSRLVEFILPSITGDNFDEGNNFGLPSASVAQTLIQTGNLHIKYSELNGHGYVLLDLTPTRAQAEFWHMADITDQTNMSEAVNAIWYSGNNQNKVQQGSTLSPPKTGVPPAPPEKGVSGVGISETFPVITHLAPNPVDSYLAISYVWNQASQITFEVLDLNGRVVFSRIQYRDAGVHNEYIDCTTLNAGSYFLVIRKGDAAATHRFVKR